MKFDQELCLNLWYDLDYIGKLNSTLGSVVNFAMFFCLYLRKDFQEKHLTGGSRFLICSFSYCKLMSIKDKNASLLPVLRALLGKHLCIVQCPWNFVFFIVEKMSPWRNTSRYDLHLIQQMIRVVVRKKTGLCGENSQVADPLPPLPPVWEFSHFYSTPSTERVESTRGNSVCLCVCVFVRNHFFLLWIFNDLMV